MKDTTNNQPIQNKTQHPSAQGGIMPLGRVLTARWGAFLLTALFLSAAIPPFVALGENTKTHSKGVDIDSQKLANAIYRAEGGKLTRYPYGIKSIPCEGETACRQICLNTINNNKKRFLKQSKYKDFIEYLGSRYCPPSAHKLNTHWVKNVTRLYKREVSR